jgi:hypothetical protein
VLEYLDTRELFAEGIDDVKASLLNVLPEDEVLNVNKPVLRFLFDKIIAKATLFNLLNKELIAFLILHELDNIIQLDWLLHSELLIKFKASGQ